MRNAQVLLTCLVLALVGVALSWSEPTMTHGEEPPLSDAAIGALLREEVTGDTMAWTEQTVILTRWGSESQTTVLLALLPPRTHASHGPLRQFVLHVNSPLVLETTWTSRGVVNSLKDHPIGGKVAHHPLSFRPRDGLLWQDVLSVEDIKPSGLDIVF